MTSRDRLAEIRAQRAREQAQTIELATFTPAPTPPPPPPAQPIQPEQPTFLNEVSAIQSEIDNLNQNVRQIATMRLHSLAVVGPGPVGPAEEDEMAHIGELTQQTRRLVHQIRDRIGALESAPAEGDAQVRNNRIGLLRSKFLEALQNYQRVEQEGRAKVRQRAERQARIVNPDATAEEIDAIIEGGGQQIFTQALVSSTRYAESRSAYREVQQRQQDLQRMEQTLTELNQLLVDMATLVEQHQRVVQDVEDTARNVQEDTRKALESTEEAVRHARNWRRGRWICFLIVFACCAALAIVLGVVLGTR